MSISYARVRITPTAAYEQLQILGGDKTPRVKCSPRYRRGILPRVSSESGSPPAPPAPAVALMRRRAFRTGLASQRPSTLTSRQSGSGSDDRNALEWTRVSSGICGRRAYPPTCHPPHDAGHDDQALSAMLRQERSACGWLHVCGPTHGRLPASFFVASAANCFAQERQTPASMK